ncbi:facilitated trehalose transporter Tret1-like [Choristoneura fumiferana]|uniref:facilitated trehalose transporter Tret1-like n=1 Tax=Choristoneura fumiferana TaxID=7141 RepID=UPI003D15BA50
MMSKGTAMAFPATLIPALQEPDSGIKIDLELTSWLVSISGLSGLAPVIMLGPIMHYGGRKVANLCVTVPILIGWILTHFAGNYNSVGMLLAGRFLQGLPLGAGYFMSVCIGEFSSPKMRNILLSVKMIAGVVGVALMHLMAYFLHWKNLALLGAVPPTLALIVTLFWPETPEWLVSRGRYTEAETVFYSLRGFSAEGERELKQLIETEKARRRENANNTIMHDLLRKLKSPVLWRPVLVLFFTMLIPVMGGRHFIASYSVHLAEQLSGDKSKGYFYTVIGNAISLPASFINVYFVKLFTRRRLMLGFGLAGVVLLVAVCLMLYIRTKYSHEVLSWLILITIAVYYFLANVAFYPVSYILMGEIFPLEYRAIGSVLDGILGSLGMAAVVAVMPWLEIGIGTHGMLLVFASIMFFSLMYLYVELPETKNRTLHDVGDYFRGKSPKIRRADDVSSVEENRFISK